MNESKLTWVIHSRSGSTMPGCQVRREDSVAASESKVGEFAVAASEPKIGEVGVFISKSEEGKKEGIFVLVLIKITVYSSLKEEEFRVIPQTFRGEAQAVDVHPERAIFRRSAGAEATAAETCHRVSSQIVIL